MARTQKTKAMADKPQTTAQSLGSLIKSARDIMRKDKGLNGDLDRLPMLTWIMFLKFLDDLEMQRKDESDLAGTKFRPAVERPYRWRDWAAQADGITGDELLAFINQDKCRRPDGTKGAGLFSYLRILTSSNGDNRRDVIATVFKGVDNRMKSGYLLRDVINKVNGIHFTASDELHTLGSLYESMLREMRDAAGDSGEFYTPRAVVRFMVDAVDPRLGETVLDPACGTGGFLVEVFSHLSRQVKTVADRKLLQTRSVTGYEAKPLPYLLAQMNLLLHGLDAPQIDPGNALRFKLTEIGEKERVNVILTNPPFGGEEEKGIQGNFPDDRQTAETALLFLQLIMRRLRRGRRPGAVPARAAVVVPNGALYEDGVAQRIREELLTEFKLHTVVRFPKGVFEPYTDIATNVLFFERGGPTESVWFYEHPLPPHRAHLKGKSYSATDGIQYEEFGPLMQWWNKRKQTDQAWVVKVDSLRESGFDLAQNHPKHANFSLPPPREIINTVRRMREVGMNVYDDIRRIGVHVFRRKLGNSNISGLFIRHPTAGKCVLVNYSEDIYRQRFTAAHEFGHTILDDEEDVIVSFTKWKKGDLVEIRANIFSSRYLMPPEFLRQIPDPTTWSPAKVIQWANQLKVSTEALAYALRDAQLVDEKTAQMLKGIRVPAETKVDPEIPADLPERSKERKRQLLAMGLSDFYVELCFDAYKSAAISRGRLAECLLIDDAELQEIAALYGRSLSYGD